MASTKIITNSFLKSGITDSLNESEDEMLWVGSFLRVFSFFGPSLVLSDLILISTALFLWHLLLYVSEKFSSFLCLV
jgi:hypothetical protein